MEGESDKESKTVFSLRWNILQKKNFFEEVFEFDKKIVTFFSDWWVR